MNDEEKIILPCGLTPNEKNKPLMMDKETWLKQMEMVMMPPHNRSNAEKFHELVYVAPLNAGADVIDALMRSFLSPFDSSVMQACITMLSGAGFDDYFDAYFKVLPTLIKLAPDTALNLFDYPGYEMRESQISQLVIRMNKLDPSGALKNEFDFQISILGLKDDFPFSSVYYKA